MTPNRHPFKTFPEFSKLTLADKVVYDRLTSKYPPTIQFSLPALLMWWGVIDDCHVAELNDNLIYSFWMPGLEEESGFCVLGDKQIDETFCAIFDFLKQQDKDPVLVHIPDFVLKNVRFPDMFKFVAEPNYDEPIINVADFSSIERLPAAKRRHMRQFEAVLSDENIAVKPIDVYKPAVKEMLYELIDNWSSAGPLNHYAKYEEIGLRKTIKYSDELGMDCIGLYIQGTLHAFFVYEHLKDVRQVNMGYTRFSYEYPHIVDIAMYKFAGWLEQEGVKRVNLDSDMGVEALRTIKLSLAPPSFVRMYTVKPADKLPHR
jgi:hypothetical protein